MRERPPPVFSRRSFLVFLVLAPACLLAVAAIVMTLQYRQFRTLVAPESAVAAKEPPPESHHLAQDVLTGLAAFRQGAGPDTVVIPPEALNALVLNSPVLKREKIRFHFSVTPANVKDSAEGTLLSVESSRPLNALNGRLAWIFQKIAPMENGWLNARLEGLPELKNRQLSLAPERGFMNDARVPKAAITKRGGMSPKDFLEPSAVPPYDSLVSVLDTVYWDGTAVVLVRAAHGAD